MSGGMGLRSLGAARRYLQRGWRGAFIAGGSVIVAAFCGTHPLLADGQPVLSLPVACEPHKTCFIQSYVDLDPSRGARDYACGGATYDGHSGVDFRVLSANPAASVPVLAAADGVVKGVRDGVADIFFSQGKPSDVTGRECGNGVVLDHGEGWETQYCHLRNGSVTVRDGDRIKTGTKLGDVGFSGMADFAHLHLSVRRDGQVVDPFLPVVPPGGCQRDALGAAPGTTPTSKTLWQPSVVAAFPYRNGQIIAAGLVAAPPDHRGLEKDHVKVDAVTTTSPAIVVYGRLINMMRGDRIRMIITGPLGSLIETTTEPLDRNKASYTAYAGKKSKLATWPTGTYEGRIELVRDGAVIATSVVTQDLRN